VIAEKHGGTTVEANLAFTCWRCNRHKGPDLASIDPDAGVFCQLFDPCAQRWRDRFVLREGVIVGVTPEGRATARLLQLNTGRAGARAAAPPVTGTLSSSRYGARGNDWLRTRARPIRRDGGESIEGVLGGLLLRRSPRLLAGAHAWPSEGSGGICAVARGRGHRGVAGRARFAPVHLHGLAVDVPTGGLPRRHPCRPGGSCAASWAPSRARCAGTSTSSGCPVDLWPMFSWWQGDGASTRSSTAPWTQPAGRFAVG
jgi:HNH endonuclease